MARDVRAYLWDAATEPERALHFVEGSDRQRYLGDDMLRAAVECKLRNGVVAQGIETQPLGIAYRPFGELQHVLHVEAQIPFGFGWRRHPVPHRAAVWRATRPR